MESEDDAALAQVRQRRLAERLRIDRETNIKSVGQLVAESLCASADRIEKAIHPIELHRRLASYIAKRVRCPGFHRAEAEKAAGYVMFPAPNEPALPMAVLAKLLDELDAADRKGQVEPYEEGIGGGRGKWFNGVLKLRLRYYRITQRKKGVRRS